MLPLHWYRLENMLRSFACLTKGDVISIKYNEKVMSYISLVGDKYKIILYTYHLFLINVKQKKQKKLL